MQKPSKPSRGESLSSRLEIRKEVPLTSKPSRGESLSSNHKKYSRMAIL